MTIRTFKGYTPQLSARVYVDPDAVIIGDVVLGEDCSVWPHATIRGDMHRIHIGARCSIQESCVLHVTHAGPFVPEGFPLTLGDDVTVGHQVTLHGCTIGSRVLLGMGEMVQSLKMKLLSVLVLWCRRLKPWSVVIYT